MRLFKISVKNKISLLTSKIGYDKSFLYETSMFGIFGQICNIFQLKQYVTEYKTRNPIARSNFIDENQVVTKSLI